MAVVTVVTAGIPIVGKSYADLFNNLRTLKKRNKYCNFKNLIFSYISIPKMKLKYYLHYNSETILITQFKIR